MTSHAETIEVKTLGARPVAEASEADAATHVQAIFDSIAPSYDLLNHLLSMGLDRHWWNRAARTFRGTVAHPNARILDICCGTGDMTAALHRLRPKSTPASTCSFCRPTPNSAENTKSGARPEPAEGPSHLEIGASTEPQANTTEAHPITGLDFSPQMLHRAHQKYAHTNIQWVEGDAMHLPYPDNSFDLVTSAFGFRNLTNYAAGLREIHRVLRPNGQIGILECNQPDGLSGTLYTLYFRHILPLIGGLISGDRAAYRYLPASVARFPRPPQMLTLLTEAGFTQPAWDGYLLRAAGLYRAIKP